QFCGTNHAGMKGEVVVMDRRDYELWLNHSAEGSLALEGRKLFLKLQCVSCHSAEARARGPILENLFGRSVPLQSGKSVVVDESYVRESIVDPQAKIAAGWHPIMPTFHRKVNEEELIQLVAFIKSLGTGQTPTRNEYAETPN